MTASKEKLLEVLDLAKAGKAVTESLIETGGVLIGEYEVCRTPEGRYAIYTSKGGHFVDSFAFAHLAVGKAFMMNL